MGGMGGLPTNGSGGSQAGGADGGSTPSGGSRSATTSTSGSAGCACGIGGHGGGDLGAVGMLSLMGAVARRRRRRLIDESSAGSKGVNSSSRRQLYILDARGTPAHSMEEDVSKWSAYLLVLKGTSLFQTDVIGEVRITTCFLNLDSPRRTNERPGQPLLWETYVMSQWQNVSTMRHSSAQAALAWHRYIVVYFRKANGGDVNSDLPPVSLRCTDGAPCDPHRFGDLRPEERCPYYCEAGGCAQEAVVEVQVDLIRYFCPRHAAWIVN
jgi:MYXO-CTERM domain-containing protein